ncbi:hypothetical protein, partial [Streptomyces mayteni]
QNDMATIRLPAPAAPPVPPSAGRPAGELPRHATPDRPASPPPTVGNDETAAIPAVEVTAQIRALPGRATPDRPGSPPATGRLVPPVPGRFDQAATQLSPQFPQQAAPQQAAPQQAVAGYAPTQLTPQVPASPPAPPAPPAMPPTAPPPPARPDQAATQLTPQVRPPAAPHAEAATQLIPPVPAGGHADEAATQLIPPVPGNAGNPNEAATQMMPPVPGNAGNPNEAATQMMPPVPGNAGNANEAATQLIPPVPDDATTQLRAIRPGTQAPQAAPRPRPQPRPHPQAQPHPYQRQPQQPQQHGQFSALFDHASAQPPGGGPQPPYRNDYDPEPPRQRNKLGIALAVIVGCAVLGLIGGALLGGGGDESDQPAGPRQTVEDEGGGDQPAEGGDTAEGEVADASPESGTEDEAEDPEARAQAEALSALLADSSASRDSVIRAVGDIRGCANLDNAANDLRAAAAQRNGLVTELNVLSLDAVQDGAALATALTEAWQASAEADDHYAAWADEARTNPAVCQGGSATHTDRANQGDAASGRATTAKERASQLWSPVAAQYGLPERTSDQL